MKTTVILSLGVCLMSVHNVWAETGTCGNDCHWTYDETNKTLAITGSGEMSGYSFTGSDAKTWLTKAPWRKYSGNIKNLSIDGISSVSSHAFLGINAENISVGNTVTSLGMGAFEAVTADSLSLSDNLSTVGNAHSLRLNGLRTLTISDQSNLTSGFLYSLDKDNLTVYCSGDTEKCKQNLSKAGYSSVRVVDVKYKELENPVEFYTLKTATERVEYIGGCEEPRCSLILWFK